MPAKPTKTIDKHLAIFAEPASLALHNLQQMSDILNEIFLFSEKNKRFIESKN